MTRDCHVWFCESAGVQFPRATHLVMGFERKTDAEEMLLALKARLAGFGLTLHKDKTRLIEFGRLAASRRQGAARGGPKLEGESRMAELLDHDLLKLPEARYASGVGRRLFGRPALEQIWIFFVDLDELDEAFNAEVGERLDTIFANAKDPYGSVLDLHFIGDVS